MKIKEMYFQYVNEKCIVIKRIEEHKRIRSQFSESTVTRSLPTTSNRRRRSLRLLGVNSALIVVSGRFPVWCVRRAKYEYMSLSILPVSLTLSESNPFFDGDRLGKGFSTITPVCTSASRKAARCAPS